MQRITTCYTQGSGWISPPDSDLDSDQTLGVFFAPSRLKELDKVVDALIEQFPRCHFIGCSTAGEIYQDSIHDDSISLGLIRFDHTRLKSASAVTNRASDSFAAGQSLAKQLSATDLRAVFVLSRGVQVNGSQMIEGLSSILPDNMVITGGLAADNSHFETTWTFGPDGLHQHQAVAVGFYGERFRIHHGSRGGWDVMGPDRKVTRSKDNVLYELDGHPALELYKRYLGERAAGLPATGLLFPLALRNEQEAERNTVRTILSVDEETQSITLAGDIPQGRFVQLMHANFDHLVDGAALAAEKATAGIQPGTSPLSIAISCVGRRLVLGQRCEEELEAALEAFPDDTVQIGFYSYGEISPLANGRCDLHNQTMTLSLIWEA